MKVAIVTATSAGNPHRSQATSSFLIKWGTLEGSLGYGDLNGDEQDQTPTRSHNIRTLSLSSTNPRGGLKSPRPRLLHPRGFLRVTVQGRARKHYNDPVPADQR